MENNFETSAIRIQSERTQFSEHSTPLYLTSSFVFEDSEEMRASFAEEKDRNLYSRFSNPNTSEFVNKIIAMEGAESGYAFATGMSAVFSTFGALLNAGDHIVSCRSVFGSTHSLFTKFLPKWNINTSYFKINEVDQIESLIQPNTKILYAESPTNPAVDILDLELLNSIAKKHNLLLVIDNCFATPYLQNPIKFGADIVIHSATKLIDGQGRVLGGVAVGKEELIREIYLFSRNTGPAMSPFNAWVLSKSLETLAVRVEKHCENALKVAGFLEKHPNVNKVKYPFLKSHPQYEIAKKQMKLGGNVVAFEIKGGIEKGKQFLDNIKLCSLSANLGDTRTIITHPASTTHNKLSTEDRLETGITDGLVRVSVGLEHIDDIINDLKQAIES
jgi:O-succinylhomoserine sulfhydrylase